MGGERPKTSGGGERKSRPKESSTPRSGGVESRRPQTARDTRSSRDGNRDNGRGAPVRGSERGSERSGKSSLASGSGSGYGQRDGGGGGRSETSYQSSQRSYERSDGGSRLTEGNLADRDGAPRSDASDTGNRRAASSYHSSVANEFFDIVGTQRPYMLGFTFKRRPENGFGRSVYGGFSLREVLPPLKHPEVERAYRNVHPDVRHFAEPNQPGPGYRRTGCGGYWGK